MHIEFSEAKRLKTLAVRGLDFARFNEIMSGPTFTQEDTRFDYPEQRFQTYGLLDGRLGICGLRYSRHLHEKMQ